MYSPGIRFVTAADPRRRAKKSRGRWNLDQKDNSPERIELRMATHNKERLWIGL
jgi:hypothetical protein